MLKQVAFSPYRPSLGSHTTSLRQFVLKDQSGQICVWKFAAVNCCTPFPAFIDSNLILMATQEATPEFDLKLLMGTWHVVHSSLTMWKKGDKRNPRIIYDGEVMET